MEGSDWILCSKEGKGEEEGEGTEFYIENKEENGEMKGTESYLGREK